MKITNKHNLPQAIYCAVCKHNRKPSHDRFSVTELIAPPLIKKLKIQYWDQLEEDASERLWSLLGQAIHSVLDKVDIETALQEEKLETEVDGAILTGRIDIYHEDGLIEDYKVTSVWSFLLGEKPEWEQQLNCYAYLFRRNGFEVNRLRINAILRDWKQSEAQKNNDYPPIPFMSIDIPLWSMEYQENFIKQRIHIHNTSSTCTQEEKWYRGEKFAVKKSNNKTALRVFDTLEEAEKFVVAYQSQYPKTSLEIEKREGEYIRCKFYCPVRNVCPENPYNTNNKENNKEEVKNEVYV